MNDTKTREIMDISVEDIIPNRFQPRLTFDTDALNELADSIREHGIIQPLVVRRLQDKFEIIAGERRYKAASLIGMKKVPCIVMDLSDNESAEVAVIENIQRKEMTPLEEAKSFKKILDKGYLTQDELAKRMGKSQSAVANKLRLLNLDEVVQDAILEGKISERHARSLLKIENKQEQRNILSEIINKRLTVRQTDDLIKEKYDNNKGVNTMNNNEVNNNGFNSNFFNQNMNNTLPQQPQDVSSIFKEPVKEEVPVSQPTYPQQNSQFLSTPEVNLPVNNVTNDVNPQLNLMNNMGMINQNMQPIEQVQSQQPVNQNSSLDIFKFDNKTPQPTVQDIQSVINPSVFSTDTIPSNEPVNNFNNMNLNNNFDNNMNNSTNNSFNSGFNNNPAMEFIQPSQQQETLYNPINNGMNIDINEVKNNAQDIMPKHEVQPDMSSLLSSNNKPENKFFVDLDFKDESIGPVLPIKVQTAVETINKQVQNLKLQGTNITKEETDLGTTYQIVIRIDK